MRLDNDDFELFGLPRRFALDRSDIDARWKTLQSEVHPDRFVVKGTAAQRIAMQWAVRVNEAYQRLKDPLRRAAYLCELHDQPLELKDGAPMPPDFLMQQMQWREALEEATSAAAVHALSKQMAEQRELRMARLERLLDEQHDYNGAAREIKALMFIERFAEDLDRCLEALEQ